MRLFAYHQHLPPQLRRQTLQHLLFFKQVHIRLEVTVEDEVNTLVLEAIIRA
jgi:uncharacterized NAD(P)/FAD-binding protein YdhS